MPKMPKIYGNNFFLCFFSANPSNLVNHTEDEFR